MVKFERNYEVIWWVLRFDLMFELESLEGCRCVKKIEVFFYFISIEMFYYM